MSIFSWLVVGLLEGLVASKLADDDRTGIFVNLMLGAAGALAAGLMFSTFAVNGLNLFSIPAALIGAVVVLVIYRALLSRSF
jgi:uncharacterized membrane protein YeaQ/YmgE (transglycosylase-associated protein family)